MSVSPPPGRFQLIARAPSGLSGPGPIRCGHVLAPAVAGRVHPRRLVALGADHEGAERRRAVVGADGDGPGSDHLPAAQQRQRRLGVVDDEHVLERRGRHRRADRAQLELDAVGRTGQCGPDALRGLAPVDGGADHLGDDAEVAAADVQAGVLGGHGRPARDLVEDAGDRPLRERHDERLRVEVVARESGLDQRVDVGDTAELTGRGGLGPALEHHGHDVVETLVDDGGDLGGDAAGTVGVHVGVGDRDRQLERVGLAAGRQRDQVPSGVVPLDLAAGHAVGGDDRRVVDPGHLGVARVAVDVVGDGRDERRGRTLGHRDGDVRAQLAAAAEPAQPDEVDEAELVGPCDGVDDDRVEVGGRAELARRGGPAVVAVGHGDRAVEALIEVRGDEIGCLGRCELTDVDGGDGGPRQQVLAVADGRPVRHRGDAEGDQDEQRDAGDRDGDARA